MSLPLATPVAEPAAIAIARLSHRYGERVALDDVALTVRRGEMFGVLGPNGGGKTTLFRVLATLVAPQAGRVCVLDHDVAVEAETIRRRLGVVFQHPSVDGKLTVLENLRCHGALYGLDGGTVRARAGRLLERFGLAARGGDRVETLSGGLARRVELAMALLHEPEILLLDEPSTGLDPGARRDLLQHLAHLRDASGVTVVLTTHLLDEAERCDRVAFVHRGAVVAVGTPRGLTAEIGGDVVVVDALDPQRLAPMIRERFGCEARLVDGALRVELPQGHRFLRDVVEAFPGAIRSASFGKPTLEDVFVRLTGHRFWSDEEAAS